MRRILALGSALLFGMFLFCCTDGSDSGEESGNSQELKRIDGIADYGWADGYYKGDLILTIDSLEDGTLCYCYFYKDHTRLAVLVEDNSVSAALFNDHAYSVSEQDDAYILYSGGTEGGLMNAISLPKAAQSKAVAASRGMASRTENEWNNVPLFGGYTKATGFIGDVKAAKGTIDNIDNGDWAGLASDAGDMLTGAAVGKLTVGIPASTMALASAPFSMVAGGVEVQKKQNAAALYNDCYAEITGMFKRDNVLTVNVAVHNIRSMSRYLVTLLEPNENEKTRNDVYVGVVGRWAYPPTTQRFHHDPKLKPQEEQIAVGAVDELVTSFTMPAPSPGEKTFFRPYLRSTRIKNLFGGVDQVYIKYGNMKEYLGMDGEITSIKNGGSYYFHSPDGGELKCGYTVSASIGSLDGVEEWGVVFRMQAEGALAPYYHYFPSQYRAAKLKDDIDIGMDYTIHETEWGMTTAEVVANEKNLQLGLYAKYKAGFTLFGEWQDFDLDYTVYEF